MKLIKHFLTLQKWVNSKEYCKRYCTLKFYLHQIQWKKVSVLRLRRTQIVRHHIAQCATDGFSRFLNPCVGLILSYKWSLHCSISEAECKSYSTAKTERPEWAAGPFGRHSGRPLYLIYWTLIYPKIFFWKNINGRPCFYNNKKLN